MYRGRHGFTVIELLVVLAAIALLLSVAAPRYVQHVDTAREVTLRQSLHQMRLAIDGYNRDQGRYPATLDDLVTHRYLRAIPVDPITQRSDTWVPAHQDERSEPVISDVRSGAKGQAMDGSRYADW